MNEPTPPLISVVMAAHNAQATLNAAIESLCAQTHTRWELWVVDDASTDGTATLIRAWMQREARICGVFLARNGGPAAARNEGLAQARGDYIAFLDADDLWHSHKLQRQWQAMAEKNWPLSYCSYVRFEDGPPHRRQTVHPPERVTLKELLVRNPIILSSAMVQRSVLGHLRFPAVRHEDYVYWHAALSRVGVAHRVPSDLPWVDYRLGTRSVSGNKLRAAFWHWCNLRQDFGLPWPQAVVCFVRYAWISLLRAWQFRRQTPSDPISPGEAG